MRPECNTASAATWVRVAGRRGRDAGLGAMIVMRLSAVRGGGRPELGRAGGDSRGSGGSGED